MGQGLFVYPTAHDTWFTFVDTISAKTALAALLLCQASNGSSGFCMAALLPVNQVCTDGLKVYSCCYICLAFPLEGDMYTTFPLEKYLYG